VGVLYADIGVVGAGVIAEVRGVFVRPPSLC